MRCPAAAILKESMGSKVDFGSWNERAHELRESWEMRAQNNASSSIYELDSHPQHSAPRARSQTSRPKIKPSYQSSAPRNRSTSPSSGTARLQ